eukprot:jgi/Bigna1/146748/aug1.120_g21456
MEIARKATIDDDDDDNTPRHLNKFGTARPPPKMQVDTRKDLDGNKTTDALEEQRKRFNDWFDQDTSDSEERDWGPIQELSETERANISKRLDTEIYGPSFEEGINASEMAETAEDRAEEQRNQGNQFIRMGLGALLKMQETSAFENKTRIKKGALKFFREAAKHYTKALTVNRHNVSENMATYRANRAQAHLYLKNYR